MQMYNRYIYLELFGIIIVSIKYKYIFHSWVIFIIKCLVNIGSRLPMLTKILEICTYSYNLDGIDIIVV